MARVFECDRCRQQQVDTDESATLRVTANDIIDDKYEYELCDACYIGLKVWINTPPKKEFSKGMKVEDVD